ncbi:hypothetical protein AB0M47_22470 [Hamadaea sp. NPDC051192]|uniref:hypothetical protein n=1 Tax=Hamadaea sp. NPDC051192 TaxID=3154940 RepID=UPI003435D39C
MVVSMLSVVALTGCASNDQRACPGSSKGSLEDWMDKFRTPIPPCGMSDARFFVLNDMTSVLQFRFDGDKDCIGEYLTALGATSSDVIPVDLSRFRGCMGTGSGDADVFWLAAGSYETAAYRFEDGDSAALFAEVRDLR